MRTLIACLALALVGCDDNASLSTSDANQSVTTDAASGGDSATAGDATGSGAPSSPYECRVGGVPDFDDELRFTPSEEVARDPDTFYRCAPAWVTECVRGITTVGRCRVDLCRDAGGCWSVMAVQVGVGPGDVFDVCTCAENYGPSPQCEGHGTPDPWWIDGCASE